jgi:nicotinamide mononucleotide transporter
MRFSWLDLSVFTLALLPMVIIGWAMGDSLLSLISSLTGVLYVLFCAKGWTIAYGFGIVNCFCYAALSFQVALYGEVLLNLGYYVPLQVVGFCAWRKKCDIATGEVRVQRLTWQMRLCVLALIGGGTLLLGAGLNFFHGATPYIDAFTTVASVVAMTLTAARYIEQWFIWLVVNGCSIYLWAHRYLHGEEHITTLIMWIVFFLCAFYGAWKWMQRCPQKKA